MSSSSLSFLRTSSSSSSNTDNERISRNLVSMPRHSIIQPPFFKNTTEPVLLRTRTQGSIPGGCKHFSLLRHVYSSCGAHPAYLIERYGFRSQEVVWPERSVVPPLTLHDFTCVADLRTETSPSRIPSMNTDLPPVKSKVSVVSKII